MLELVLRERGIPGFHAQDDGAIAVQKDDFARLNVRNEISAKWTAFLNRYAI